MTKTYFLSFDQVDNRAAITEKIRVATQSDRVMPYAGGWLVISDHDLTTLYTLINSVGAGQALIAPVNAEELKNANVLSSQAQNFITNQIRAA